LANNCDLSEFEMIFRNYKDMVFKTAYLMTGDAEEAEDILQDVFVKVHKSWNKFNPEKGGLYTWIHRITVNHCISNRRRKQSVDVSLDKLEEQGFEFSAANLDIPEELLMKQEESRRIWLAMNALDAKHRSVIVLRYYEGLPYEDIAQTLQVPVGTVKSRLNTAMQTLRRELVEGGVVS